MELGPNLLRWILGAIICVSVLLIVYFVFFFFWPSLRLRSRLGRVNKALRERNRHRDKSDLPEDPNVVRDQIMNVEPFRHLWTEYIETLHRQTDVIDGEVKVVTLRATVPAETFFNTEVLVHTALRTEFFKHLPGIFTGIGIIGTFSGLIVGLDAFQISDESQRVRESLKDLLNSVSAAFMVSAGAITLAMVVTFLEKISVTQRYKQVEDLCHIIDGMYVSGVGEEYLARLVKASEESATQTTQLKDSFVEDLKEMMTNQVDRQIEATQASNQAMAASITQSITGSLRGPMEAISKVVDRASESQGSAVQQALSDVIAAFMARLEEVFGGQIAGLNALMRETTASMRDTRDRFAELVENLSGAGRSAGEAMSEQLTRAMEAAELRQREMNNQMRQFVEQIGELVSKSQSETSDKLSTTLEALDVKVAGVIHSLSEQQARASQEALQRQETIASSSQVVVSGLNDKVNALLAPTSEAVHAMKESISALRSMSAESVEKMNKGADTLSVAASEFSKAGQGVTGVLERAIQVTERLSIVATGMDAAAKTVELAVGTYDRTRSDLATMTESLKGIVESTKREAGLSKELVLQLEVAAGKFGVAQKDAADYLEKVSGVLEECFAKFTEVMRDSLNRSRTDFDKSLGEAVGMLRSTIDDLDDLLGRLPGRT